MLNPIHKRNRDPIQVLDSHKIENTYETHKRGIHGRIFLAHFPVYSPLDRSDLINHRFILEIFPHAPFSHTPIRPREKKSGRFSHIAENFHTCLALCPLFPNTVLGWNFSRDPKNLSLRKRKDGGTKKRRKKKIWNPKKGWEILVPTSPWYSNTCITFCVHFPPFSAFFVLYVRYTSRLLQTGNSRSVSSPFLFFFCVKRRSNNAWGEIGGGGRKEQSALLFFVIVVASLSLPPTTRFEEWKLKRQSLCGKWKVAPTFFF